MATASASAASGPAIFAPGSRRETIACTCTLSAPPVPTTAFFTSVGAYSPTAIPARAAHIRTTPRAWPSLSVDCGFLLTKTSSTAAPSGACSAMSVSSWRAMSASRFGSGAAVSVLSWPLAMWERRLPSAWMTPQPVVPSPGSNPSSLGKLLQLLVGDVVIAPDGLDVVVLFERVDELHQRAGIVAADLHFEPGLPAELDRFRLAQSTFQGLGDFVEGIDGGPYLVAVLVGLHVVGAGFDRCFQHLVRIAHARAIFDQAHPLEAVAHGSRRAEIAAILREGGADVGRGAVTIVGERLDDDRDAARAKALVANFFVAFGVRARCLVDRPLNVVLGHRLRLGREDGRAQAGIHFRIRQAHLRRDGDFAAQFREHRRALFVLRPLAMHDVLEFGMTRHCCSLRETERVAICFEDRVLFLACVRLHPAKTDDHAHDLRVVTVGLGLCVDVLHVVRDALLLFLKTLDPLDE